MENIPTVTIEDAQLIFRNFEGKEGAYNRAGDRNFGVVLSPEIADAMAADGWNVKVLEPREEGDLPTAYISVTVSFKNKPPKIIMITSADRVPITEDLVETLDWVDIKTVDLILTPYKWIVGDKSGIKAYLKTMFITIEEDELERKYAKAAKTTKDKSNG